MQISALHRDTNGNSPLRQLRFRVILSISPTTKGPESEVPATAARHSRLKSAVTRNTRKRQASQTLFETKSSAYLWFNPCRIAIGANIPKARLQPCFRTLKRRVALPLADYCATVKPSLHRSDQTMSSVSRRNFRTHSCLLGSVPPGSASEGKGGTVSRT